MRIAKLIRSACCNHIFENSIDAVWTWRVPLTLTDISYPVFESLERALVMRLWITAIRLRYAVRSPLVVIKGRCVQTEFQLCK
jgi:hypothetical protein